MLREILAENVRGQTMDDPLPGIRRAYQARRERDAWWAGFSWGFVSAVSLVVASEAILWSVLHG